MRWWSENKIFWFCLALMGGFVGGIFVAIVTSSNWDSWDELDEYLEQVMEEPPYSRVVAVPTKPIAGVSKFAEANPEYDLVEATSSWVYFQAREK